MTQPQTICTLARLWCGLLVVASTGCQTYSPYGYGGGYSGSYPAYDGGGQVMPYNGAVMPQGTMVQPVPQPGYYQGGALPPNPGSVTPLTPYPNVPNGGFQQGVDSSGDNFGQPGNFPNGTAPQPNVPNQGAGAGPVPDYGDPASPPVPTVPSAPLGNVKRPAPPAQIGGPEEFESKNPLPGRAAEKLKNMENSPVPSAMLDSGDFAPPISRGGDGTIIQTAQHQESQDHLAELRPYGRAPNGQDWFRGLVDFDEEENAWYLIYNPEPDATDKQGGTITLVEHPHLKLFKGDDVVLVEGAFDPSETDRYGNPKYRAGIVRRLIP